LICITPLHSCICPYISIHVILHCLNPTPLLYRCVPDLPTLFLRACASSLLIQDFPLLLYPILAFTLGFSLTLFFRLNASVYCCIVVVLGAHTLYSSAISLVYINLHFLCHFWVQRGQAKLTRETWDPSQVKLLLSESNSISLIAFVRTRGIKTSYAVMNMRLCYYSFVLKSKSPKSNKHPSHPFRGQLLDDVLV
jgi:hypothetical protein